MLGRMLLAMAGAGGRATWGLGSRLVPAAAGFGYGAAAGAVGMAAGVGYLGYRAVRGWGPAMGGPTSLNRGIQTRMIGGVMGAGAVAGMLTRNPGYRADFSPGGNLEVKGPAMLEATGDVALSLNRNARRIPAPTQYGYMTTTTVPGTGRY